MKIIVTCEHGGNNVPTRYRPLFRESRRLLSGHRGYDRGSLAVARGLSEKAGAALFFSRTTRLLIDLNRSPHHPRLFSEVTKYLPGPEKEYIKKRYYLPYRTGVLSSVSNAVSGGALVLHISVHTFIHVFNGRNRDADIGLLYDPSRPLEKSLCMKWQNAIVSGGQRMKVRRNYPYAGVNDGLVKHLRKLFARDRYIGIELEVNQRSLSRGERKHRLLLDALGSALLPSLQIKNLYAHQRK